MISKFRLLLVCGVATIALPGVAFASPYGGLGSDLEAGANGRSSDGLAQLALNLDGSDSRPLSLPRGSVMQATSSSAGGSSPQSVESVTVTGSRIAGNAAQAPTPITSLSDDQLQSLSSQSIPAGLAKLPVFAPVRGSDTASDGGYQPTGNYMDLYGLGPIRTLVLEDGHRV
ncbi:MAG: hypothetical protein J0G99_16495, partial [Alphaproteobacteria bacterium]|nr:hypothetical protein [Alphaproteobacteria bacterium]